MTTVVNNKKARFDYHILETIDAGLILKGTEIKAIRENKANIKEGYCFFKKQQLYIKGMYIGEYGHGNIYNHEPFRERQLLLTKRQLKKLYNQVREKGVTIVPIKLFLSDRGIAKLQIGTAKGKKLFDKRESMKQKDNKRQIDRMMKY